MADQPKTADQLRAEQDREYGTYIATEQIFVGNALAFNVGDKVPVSHVERGVVREDQVAKVTTKAGRAAADEAVTAESAKA